MTASSAMFVGMVCVPPGAVSTKIVQPMRVASATVAATRVQLQTYAVLMLYAIPLTTALNALALLVS